MHQSGIISLATLQLQIENTYSAATINSCCGFDFNTHFRLPSLQLLVQLMAKLSPVVSVVEG